MKEKTKPQTQNASPQMLGEGRLRRLPLTAGLLLAVVVWGLLNFFEHEFLFRVQELSLWLPTKVYFDERMLVPGGMMSYIACFFTQFFYYPMLGSLVYVALLLVVQWLTMRVFRTPCTACSHSRSTDCVLLDGGGVLDIPNQDARLFLFDARGISFYLVGDAPLPSG